jgi:hypothetical protein
MGDLGYRGKRLAEAGQALGISVEVIARGRGGQFIPAGICWVVERPFAFAEPLPAVEYHLRALEGAPHRFRCDRVHLNPLAPTQAPRHRGTQRLTSRNRLSAQVPLGHYSLLIRRPSLYRPADSVARRLASGHLGDLQRGSSPHQALGDKPPERRCQLRSVFARHFRHTGGDEAQVPSIGLVAIGSDDGAMLLVECAIRARYGDGNWLMP